MKIYNIFAYSSINKYYVAEFCYARSWWPTSHMRSRRLEKDYTTSGFITFYYPHSRRYAENLYPFSTIK